MRTYGPAARRDFLMGGCFWRGALGGSRSASASSVSDSEDEGVGFGVLVGVAVRWTLRRVERRRVFRCEL